MPRYRIKLGDFETYVDVPKRIRGINRTADYITRHLADKYASKTTRPHEFRKRRGRSNNWYDSHIDPITELLLDLREKLRDRHG